MIKKIKMLLEKVTKKQEERRRKMLSKDKIINRTFYYLDKYESANSLEERNLVLDEWRKERIEAR